MSDLAIRTSGLVKRYGDVTAVAGVDLAVRRGEVYGFLGRNGAGKTTTMRMLVGLVRPTAGTIELDGRPYDGRTPVARIGALIEAPRFYPHLSGGDNLRLLCHYFGAPAAQVPALLDRVGLTGAATARFGGYSLGMKQRLGVASALLGDPEILILDEPTNGLDPGGVADIRDMVRGLRAAGHTVVLSSHRLAEVEQVCDRVGILHDGHLVAQGSPAELEPAIDAGSRLVVTVADPLGAAAVVRGVSGVDEVSIVDGGIEVTCPLELAAAVNRSLALTGHDVAELRIARRSLESVFLDLTTAGAGGR